MSTDRKVLKDVYALTEKYPTGQIRRTLRVLSHINRTRYALEDINAFVFACNEASIEVPSFVITKHRNLERKLYALEQKLEWKEIDS